MGLLSSGQDYNEIKLLKEILLELRRINQALNKQQ